MMSRNGENEDVPYNDSKFRTNEVSKSILSPKNGGSKSTMRHVEGLLGESLLLNGPNKTLYKV